jgi:hypothetical protein
MIYDSIYLCLLRRSHARPQSHKARLVYNHLSKPLIPPILMYGTIGRCSRAFRQATLLSGTYLRRRARQLPVLIVSDILNRTVVMTVATKEVIVHLAPLGIRLPFVHAIQPSLLAPCHSSSRKVLIRYVFSVTHRRTRSYVRSISSMWSCVLAHAFTT